MDYFSIILKTAIFFFCLLFIIRLLGKREVGEISVFDLVVLLIIADIATVGIQADWKNVLIVIVSLITLLFLQKLVAILTLKIPKLRGVGDFKPSIIIYNGKLNIEEMKKQSYTVDDLIAQARGRGIMDLSEIKMAILESSGELSVFTSKEYKSEYLPVVISGEINKENLKYLDLTIEEINRYLESQNLNFKNVYYLSSNGTDFILLKNL